MVERYSGRFWWKARCCGDRDSSTALALTKHPIFHERSKHIDVKLHFVRDEIQKGEIKMLKVSTDHTAADMLTKALPAQNFKYCLELVGLWEWCEEIKAGKGWLLMSWLRWRLIKVVMHQGVWAVGFVDQPRSTAYIQVQRSTWAERITLMRASAGTPSWEGKLPRQCIRLGAQQLTMYACVHSH